MTKVLDIFTGISLFAGIIQSVSLYNIYNSHLVFPLLWSHGGRRVVRESETLSDYYFAKKLSQPCGAGREALEAVTVEEVISMVGTVKNQIMEANTLIVSK